MAWPFEADMARLFGVDKGRQHLGGAVNVPVPGKVMRLELDRALRPEADKASRFVLGKALEYAPDMAWPVRVDRAPRVAADMESPAPLDKARRPAGDAALRQGRDLAGSCALNEPQHEMPL